MKRRFILVAAALVMLLSWPVWAQIPPTISSLESQISFGLFTTPIDAAFNVSQADSTLNFNLLKNSYIFTGLTNFTLGSAGSGAPFILPETIGQFTLGFYSKGNMPWSVFLVPDVASTSLAVENGLNVIATGTVNVVSGTTTTTYTYATQTQQLTYARMDDTDVDIFGQLLFGLGSLDMGAVLRFQRNETLVAANNLTQVDSIYYLTTGPGVVPVTALDRTVTTTTSAPASAMEIVLGVPLSMKMGAMPFAAYLQATFDRNNNSSSTTIERSAYADPATVGGVPVIFSPETTTDNITGSIAIDAAASFTLASLIKGDSRNRLDFTLNADATLNTAGNLVQTTLNRVYTTPAGAGDLVYVTGSDVVTTTNRVGGLGFGVAADAGNSVYINLADGVTVGFKPTVGLEFDSTPANNIFSTQRVQTVSVDGDGDGLYTSAADAVTTTTTTYFNFGGGTSSLGITADVDLPASLKLKLPNWPFGITIGTTLHAGTTFSINTTTDETTRAEVVVADGTGAITTTTITEPDIANPMTSTHFDWLFQERHLFGLNIFLPANATLDVFLAGSNLLLFESLSLQVIIPL